MIDYERFIRELGPCYHLHIEDLGISAEHLHRQHLDNFNKAIRLRCIRRVRPTYLRIVNIEDRTKNPDSVGYRYICDIVSPSLNLLAEMCPAHPPIDICASRLSAYQIARCFEWPVKTDIVDHTTHRIITPMHPLVAVTKLLAAYPKRIESFRIGTSHTLYMTPFIDYDDHFNHDPMPFKYKRFTHYQPITYTYRDLES